MDGWRKARRAALRLLLATAYRLVARGRTVVTTAVRAVDSRATPVSQMRPDELNAALRRGERVGERHELRWAAPVTPRGRRAEHLAVAAALGVAALVHALRRRTE